MNQLCKVDREGGPTHCPVARQIEPGEGMYIALCILPENIYFPDAISGLCIYCVEIVFLFCTCIVALHAGDKIEKNEMG